MNLEYLRIFHAVAETGSVTAGAERLASSQPGISRQLRRLERNLRTRLFDRQPRGVKLTEAGELLLGCARRIFAVEAEAQQVLAELQGLQRGQLRVGASLTIGAYLLPQAVTAFHRAYPGIQVQVAIANTREVHERLISGQLDLALTEGLVESELLASVTFAEDELLAIAPPGHRLLSQNKVTAAALCREGLILREEGSGTRAVIERALARRHLSVKPIMSLGSTGAIKAAVRCGAGLAIVSGLAVETELRTGELAHLRIGDLSMRRSLHQVMVRGQSPSRAAAAFMQLLSQAASAPPPRA